ncbi:MAG: hypothetical protein AUJ75_00545 [Candidatus Omnitrophica bacterium CG1_02_49_10]|nr:MAG: hypothetical protein AUJ75_00545 [Candidatus Omnitrophica bacterium CG1_02_49_10]
MYISKSIKVYLDDLAARKAAPGGGSAAALAGSLGVALIEMMINYTIGNPKYNEAEDEMRSLLGRAEELRMALESLVDRDVEMYRRVSEAKKMPRESKDEREKREAAIQKALKDATAIPMDICRCALRAIKICPTILEKGNIYLSSDAGVASELLEASFNAALLNVYINLKDIKDDSFVLSTRAALESMEREVLSIKEAVWAKLKKEG